MPDYSNTIIYKICCNDTEIKEIYVGSTCNFINRRYQHKSKCHNENIKEYNFKIYQFIRANGGWENWNMIMVDEANLDNKLQKSKLEREWIEKLGASLNINIPGRTGAEWRETYKEQYKEYFKEYREINKEEIQITKNQKFECECGGKYTLGSKARHFKTKKHLSKIASSP